LEATKAEVSKLQLELRERLVELREKDILELRWAVAKLTTGVLVVSLLAAFIAWFGWDTYKGAMDGIKNVVNEKAEERSRYYSAVQKAFYNWSTLGCSVALAQFEELAAKNPKEEDEVVFNALLGCYVQAGELDKGLKYLERVKNSGAFPQKYASVNSYSTVAWLLIIKSIHDGDSPKEAEDLFKKADEMASRANDSYAFSPVSGLVVLNVAKDDLDAAKRYADRLKDLSRGNFAFYYSFPGAEQMWLKSLRQSHQPVVDELEKGFPNLFSVPPQSVGRLGQ
jgi:pentatricopeptide repeat protein